MSEEIEDKAAHLLIDAMSIVQFMIKEQNCRVNLLPTLLNKFEEFHQLCLVNNLTILVGSAADLNIDDENPTA